MFGFLKEQNERSWKCPFEFVVLKVKYVDLVRSAVG